MNRLIRTLALTGLVAFVRSEQYKLLPNKCLFKDYWKACDDDDMKMATVSAEVEIMALLAAQIPNEDAWIGGFQKDAFVHLKDCLTISINKEKENSLRIQCYEEEKETAKWRPLCQKLDQSDLLKRAQRIAALVEQGNLHSKEASQSPKTKRKSSLIQKDPNSPTAAAEARQSNPESKDQKKPAGSTKQLALSAKNIKLSNPEMGAPKKSIDPKYTSVDLGLRKPQKAASNAPPSPKPRTAVILQPSITQTKTSPRQGFDINDITKTSPRKHPQAAEQSNAMHNEKSEDSEEAEDHEALNIFEPGRPTSRLSPMSRRRSPSRKPESGKSPTSRSTKVPEAGTSPDRRLTRQDIKDRMERAEQEHRRRAPREDEEALSESQGSTSPRPRRQQPSFDQAHTAGSRKPPALGSAELPRSRPRGTTPHKEHPDSRTSRTSSRTATPHRTPEERPRAHSISSSSHTLSRANTPQRLTPELGRSRTDASQMQHPRKPSAAQPAQSSPSSGRSSAFNLKPRPDAQRLRRSSVPSPVLPGSLQSLPSYAHTTHIPRNTPDRKKPTSRKPGRSEDDDSRSAGDDAERRRRIVGLARPPAPASPQLSLSHPDLQATRKEEEGGIGEPMALNLSHVKRGNISSLSAKVNRTQGKDTKMRSSNHNISSSRNRSSNSDQSYGRPQRSSNSSSHGRRKTKSDD